MSLAWTAAYGHASPIRAEDAYAHSCAGKERFASYQDAARAAAAQRKRKGGRRHIEAYRCGLCGERVWHVGRRKARPSWRARFAELAA